MTMDVWRLRMHEYLTQGLEEVKRDDVSGAFIVLVLRDEGGFRPCISGAVDSSVSEAAAVEVIHEAAETIRGERSLLDPPQ